MFSPFSRPTYFYYFFAAPTRARDASARATREARASSLQPRLAAGLSISYGDSWAGTTARAAHPIRPAAALTSCVRLTSSFLCVRAKARSSSVSPSRESESSRSSKRVKSSWWTGSRRASCDS